MSVERNQNILVANEEPVIHWDGNIHVGENSYGSEFVATDRRLLYNQGGMTKDIDYRHITSVEAGTEVKDERHIPDLPDAFIGSAVAVMAGIFLFGIGQFSGPLATLGGLLFFVGIIGGLYTRPDSDEHQIEKTEKVIHHVRLIRDNEAPLYITTGSDVGSRLRNLVAESKQSQ